MVRRRWCSGLAAVVASVSVLALTPTPVAANDDIVPAVASQIGTEGGDRVEAVAMTDDLVVVVGDTGRDPLPGAPGGQRPLISAYAAAFGGDGSVEWVYHRPGSRNSFASYDDVVALADGGVVAAGRFGSSGAAFVTHLDAQGRVEWERTFTGTNGLLWDAEVTVDGAGDVWVAGSTDGNLDGRNRGRADIVVFRLDDRGRIDRTIQFGNPANNWIRGLVGRPGGGVHVVEWESEPSTFSSRYLIRSVDADGSVSDPIETVGSIRSARPTPSGGLVVAGTSLEVFSASLQRAVRVDRLLVDDAVVDANGHIYTVSDSTIRAPLVGIGFADLLVRQFDAEGQALGDLVYGTIAADTDPTLALHDGELAIGFETRGDLVGLNAGAEDVAALRFSAEWPIIGSVTVVAEGDGDTLRVSWTAPPGPAPSAYDVYWEGLGDEQVRRTTARSMLLSRTDLGIGPNSAGFFTASVSVVPVYGATTGLRSGERSLQVDYDFLPPPVPRGYWIVDRKGEVWAFGEVEDEGDATFATRDQVDTQISIIIDPISGPRTEIIETVTPGPDAVSIEPTTDGRGYWILLSDGDVAARGSARHRGDAEGELREGELAASLSATPEGDGYWIFTNRGRVLPFGAAVSYGDMDGIPLNGPVLGSVATPSGLGYYMVASDGGIFAFGDADFRGSMGGRPLNQPVTGLVPDPDGEGYWLVASDGGVFAFDADFRGSMGSTPLNQPVSSMIAFADGYLMVAADGGVFNFSSEQFFGSLGSDPPDQPVIAIATP